MGPESRRDAALTPALAETLAHVAGALADASAPWWIIGSAAVILHGGDTTARDVDVLLDTADARSVAERLGLADRAGDGDARFRSAVLLRWRAPPIAVEFMAGLDVRMEHGWRAIQPTTRMAAAGVFLPDAVELAAMLATFGRPKDRNRAALLRPACETG